MVLAQPFTKGCVDKSLDINNRYAIISMQSRHQSTLQDSGPSPILHEMQTFGDAFFLCLKFFNLFSFIHSQGLDVNNGYAIISMQSRHQSTLQDSGPSPILHEMQTFGNAFFLCLIFSRLRGDFLL